MNLIERWNAKADDGINLDARDVAYPFLYVFATVLLVPYMLPRALQGGLQLADLNPAGNWSPVVTVCLGIFSSIVFALVLVNRVAVGSFGLRAWLYEQNTPYLTPILLRGVLLALVAVFSGMLLIPARVLLLLWVPTLEPYTDSVDGVLALGLVVAFITNWSVALVGYSFPKAVRLTVGRPSLGPSGDAEPAPVSR